MLNRGVRGAVGRCRHKERLQAGETKARAAGVFVPEGALGKAGHRNEATLPMWGAEAAEMQEGKMS
ncbi:MAG: hypothetical protein KGZ82_08655 [Bacteroidales bacterium]|nr:hypothetical protein [Bacteroidales bacterium]